MKSFDVAVIGGGLIGGSIAFDLSSRGHRVILFDRQQPGREASWAAAGMLSPGPDEPAALPLVPLAKQSLALYPAFISAVEAASGHQTGFAQDGTIEVFVLSGGGADDPEAERDRVLAEHQALGLASEPVSIEQARQMEPALGPSAQAAMWLPYEATVEPRLLTQAVLEAAGSQGVEIRVQSPAACVLCEKESCVGVLAGNEKIQANWVVLAAGCFSENVLLGSGLAEAPRQLRLPVHPVRGQMIALRPRDAKVRRVLRSRRGYLVPRSDGRIVAGSTLENAGFEKHVTPAGLRKILDAAEEMLPTLKDAEIVETWSGLRPATPDSLPLLGPCGVRGLLIATGHYRNGILLAPATAKLIAEWIEKGSTSLDTSRFSPDRFSESKSFEGSRPKLQTASPS